MIVLFTFVACLILSNLLCFNIKLARFVKEVKLIYKIQITLSEPGSSRRVSVLRYTWGRNIKLFTVVIKNVQQKAAIFVILCHFHPNLIFVGKARSPPLDLSPVGSPARVGSTLDCKHKTRAVVTNNDQHSSLLPYATNYG